MSEESSNVSILRQANSPNALDLRQIGAHPDYWYPLAWSYELKPGKTLARRFALAGSIGSDFHEPDLPWRPVGRFAKLPDGVTPITEHLP